MSRRLIDLNGQRFNRLTVIARNPENNRQNKPMWICTCDCGNTVVVTGSDLKSGNTNSCGCYRSDRDREVNLKHGLTHTNLYYVWSNVKDRCNNPRNKKYKDYGGRGIKVYEKWQHDFMSFYEWAIENGYEQGLSLDRANNDDGYYPWNCVWSTPTQQNRNKRNCTSKALLKAFKERMY